MGSAHIDRHTGTLITMLAYLHCTDTHRRVDTCRYWGCNTGVCRVRSTLNLNHLNAASSEEVPQRIKHLRFTPCPNKRVLGERGNGAQSRWVYGQKTRFGRYDYDITGAEGRSSMTAAFGRPNFAHVRDIGVFGVLAPSTRSNSRVTALLLHHTRIAVCSLLPRRLPRVSE